MDKNTIITLFVFNFILHRTNSNSICDLKKWYLKNLGEGLFDKVMSPYQESIQVEIEELLIQSRKDPSKADVDCTVLKQAEDILKDKSATTQNDNKADQNTDESEIDETDIFEEDETFENTNSESEIVQEFDKNNKNIHNNQNQDISNHKHDNTGDNENVNVNQNNENLNVNQGYKMNAIVDSLEHTGNKQSERQESGRENVGPATHEEGSDSLEKVDDKYNSKEKALEKQTRINTDENKPEDEMLDKTGKDNVRIDDVNREEDPNDVLVNNTDERKEEINENQNLNQAAEETDTIDSLNKKENKQNVKKVEDDNKTQQENIRDLVENVEGNSIDQTEASDEKPQDSDIHKTYSQTRQETNNNDDIIHQKKENIHDEVTNDAKITNHEPEFLQDEINARQGDSAQIAATDSKNIDGLEQKSGEHEGLMNTNGNKTNDNADNQENIKSEKGIDHNDTAIKGDTEMTMKEQETQSRNLSTKETAPTKQILSTEMNQVGSEEEDPLKPLTDNQLDKSLETDLNIVNYPQMFGICTKDRSSVSDVFLVRYFQTTNDVSLDSDTCVECNVSTKSKTNPSLQETNTNGEHNSNSVENKRETNLEEDLWEQKQIDENAFETSMGGKEDENSVTNDEISQQPTESPVKDLQDISTILNGESNADENVQESTNQENNDGESSDNSENIKQQQNVLDKKPKEEEVGIYEDSTDQSNTASFATKESDKDGNANDLGIYEEQQKDILDNNLKKDQEKDSIEYTPQQDRGTYNTKSRHETHADETDEDRTPKSRYTGSHDQTEKPTFNMEVIEQLFKTKTIEYSSKIQNLEILIMKLENKLLGEKLDKQNHSSTITRLENSILKLENELLKLNHSHNDMKTDNEKLNKQRNTYLELDHIPNKSHKQRKELTDESAKNTEIITEQQNKIFQLAELLKNQSKAIHNMKSKYEYLEDQNRMLFQMVMNQTSLMTHIMSRVQELSDQNIQQRIEAHMLKEKLASSKTTDQINGQESLRATTKLMETLDAIVSDKELNMEGTESDMNLKKKNNIESNSSTDESDDKLKEYVSKTNRIIDFTNKWCEGRNTICLFRSIRLSTCVPFVPVYWSACEAIRTIHTLPKPTYVNNKKHNQKKNAIKQDKTKLQDSDKINAGSSAKEVDTAAENAFIQENENSIVQVSVKSTASKTESEKLQNEQVNEKVRIVNSETDNSLNPKETKEENHIDKSKKLNNKMPELDERSTDELGTDENTKRNVKHSPEEQIREKHFEQENIKNRKNVQEISNTQATQNVPTDFKETKMQRPGKSGTGPPATETMENKKMTNLKQSGDPKGHKRVTEDLTSSETSEKSNTNKPLRFSNKDQDKAKEHAINQKKLLEKQDNKKPQKRFTVQEKETIKQQPESIKVWKIRYEKGVQTEPKDCYDYYLMGQKRNTIYKVKPYGLKKTISVYCDMKGGGWTLIQKRSDGTTKFFKEWEDYKTGFGGLYGEHWLGNDYIHYLTNQDNYKLRIDLTDWNKTKKFAEYNHFSIDDEKEGYKLAINGYSGDVGDGMAKHNGHKFSTKDVDNDKVVKEFGGSCANRFNGAWWYYKCYMSNLNGIYYRNGQIPHKMFDGITWKPWTGPNYSLRSVEMKIRPASADNK